MLLRVLLFFGGMVLGEDDNLATLGQVPNRLVVLSGISYTTNKTLPYRTWNVKPDFFNNENLNRERLFVFATLTKRKRFYDVQPLELHRAIGYTR